MKKLFSLFALLLSVLMLFSGCSTISVLLPADPSPSPTAVPTATPTAEPTATPTAEPTATPTAEPTPSPTPETTATPEPAENLTGCTWIAYHESVSGEFFVFELNFHKDGTMDYMSGWYRSEIAYYGTGTYSADAKNLEYSLTADGYSPASLSGSVGYTCADNTLTLTLDSGDALTYILKSEPLVFAAKGSAQDIPPEL